MDLKKGIKNMFGLGDDDLYDDDEYYEEEYAPPVKERERRPIDDLESYKRTSAPRKESRPHVVPLQGGVTSPDGAKISIVKPKSFDDSKEICDSLKQNRILVINTTEMEAKPAQRLLDFVCGAAYNSGGDVQEIERGVYVLSPSMVEVSRDNQAVSRNSFFEFMSDL